MSHGVALRMCLRREMEVHYLPSYSPDLNPAASIEDENVLRDAGGIAESGEQDRLIWIPVDSNQHIHADIGDRHACGEVIGGDSESRNVQDILAASRSTFEIRYPVVAEARREDEAVATIAAGQRIRTGTALKTIIARIADERIGKGRTDDVLHATDQVALRITTEAGDRFQFDAQVDGHACCGATEIDGVVARPAIDDVGISADHEPVVAGPTREEILT